MNNIMDKSIVDKFIEEIKRLNDVIVKLEQENTRLKLESGKYEVINGQIYEIGILHKKPKEKSDKYEEEDFKYF
jgi:hypothetical protein